MRALYLSLLFCFSSVASSWAMGAIYRAFA